jgi:Domain of unknown function (DUF4114)
MGVSPLACFLHRIGAERSMSLALLLACTDYGFSSEGDHGGDSKGFDVEVDEDDTPATTDDACFEPEYGYSANPEAQLYTMDSSTPVTITFVLSSSDYSNTLWLETPEEVQLAQTWSDAPNSDHTLGPWLTNSELSFAIQPEETGDYWQSGPASRNEDGFPHVAVTYVGDCVWMIGFEDQRGGGDQDFNDVVLRVSGELRQEG